MKLRDDLLALMRTGLKSEIVVGARVCTTWQRHAVCGTRVLFAIIPGGVTGLRRSVT